MTQYNGFEIDHTPPSWCRDLETHYRRKAEAYCNLSLALEWRAKRAGKGSKIYTRYLRLIETSLKYSALSKHEGMHGTLQNWRRLSCSPSPTDETG